MDSYGVPEWGSSPGEEQQYKHSISDLDHPFTIGFNDDIRLSGILDSVSPIAPQDCMMVDSLHSSEQQSSNGTQNCALAQEGRNTEVNDRPRKRKNRTAETHNLTEKRRRDKIKAKIKVLRELIPNSQKLDKASLLDKAMSHIKTLQWQLQMMRGMNPYPYMFAPPTPHCGGTTTQLSLFGTPTLPNTGVGMNTTNMSTIQPQLALGIPYNPPFWRPVAGNFLSMPSLPPNPYFQPSFNSTFMQPQSPSMSAHASSLSRGSSGFFQVTDGTLHKNEMFP